MSVQPSILDAARRCELEVWRALAGVVSVTLETWTGSETVRTALERVSAVIDEQVERTGSRKGGKLWMH